MNIRDKILVQKYFLNIFNGIFLALGLVLLQFGLWLLCDRNNLFSVILGQGDNRLVAFISCMLLGTGSIITFTSAIGFLGSVKEIKCLLVTYMSFQVLLFGTQFAISVMTFVKKEEVHNQWNSRIDEVISEYGNKSLAEKEPMWNILNAVQHNMECCGRYNITQWDKNKNKGNSTEVPCSCTKSSLKKWFCDVPRNSTYHMGCEEYLDTWFENTALILTAINVGLLILQVRVILKKKTNIDILLGIKVNSVLFGFGMLSEIL
ncbi:tetraspanin-19 [Apteryx mantelli]|uniref:Tetraspanin n=2 Tax=Apteryx TaxID=8821 RepID=A0ABM4EKS5_9AVES